MDLQELLARIESISAKDVELGQVLKALVLYVAKLERVINSKEASSAN